MSAVPREEGVCRICFEGSPGLIAPCACKGSSKWIHRDCLNKWRVIGVNPRALSNCTTCGSQYQMVLQRMENTDVEERQRWLLYELSGQTLATFLVVQLSIIFLGMGSRYVDEHEKLVTAFRLPQDPAHREPSTFGHAMHYHKCTYYLAGALCFLVILGVLAVALGMVHCCCGGERRSQNVNIVSPPACDCNYCCVYACNDAVHSCDACCECEHCCGMCSAIGFDGGGGAAMPDVGEGIIVVVAILLLVLLLLGLLMLLVGIVIATQAFAKRYAQIQNLRILASEYVVQDLDGSDDDGLLHAPKKHDIEDQPIANVTVNRNETEVQQQLAHDISRIFAHSRDMPVAATRYGAA